MRRLEDMLDSINAEVNNEIISAVKRATLHITSKIGSNKGGLLKDGMNVEQLE